MPLKEIECYNCGFKLKKKVLESINISENPKQRKDIIQGKINFSYCPECKAKINHKTHVLLSYLDPPRWIWLVDKRHQSPRYQEEFFRSIVPESYSGIIEQEMVFVEFGEQCNSLCFILDGKQPQTSNDWLELGKILAGERAIECYKNALRLDQTLAEAKKLLNDELDKLKTYS
jgi:hypothetical protein